MREDEKIYILRLSDFQRRLLINGLNEYLTLLSEREQPAEDVCDLLSDVMNAAQQKDAKRRKGLFARIR
jgi:hypothetical protein